MSKIKDWLMPKLKHDPVFESLREKLYRELERKEAEASQECRIVNTYLYKK